MTSKFKRIIITAVLFALSLNFTALADSIVSLTLPEGFFVHEKAPGKVAEILDMKESALNDYCINNSILYLAVDSNNQKQIRVTVSENGFSSKIVNISQLTDDKISSLAPDIAGIDGVRGAVVKNGNQKFLKVELSSEDNGGEYILTQYITVAQKQNFVLSFYNSIDVNTDYIDAVFESLSCDMFEDTEITDDTDKSEEKINLLLIIVPIAAIAFLFVCIGLSVSIIIDIKKNRDEADEDYFENENTPIEENQPQDDNNNLNM